MATKKTTSDPLVTDPFDTSDAPAPSEPERLTPEVEPEVVETIQSQGIGPRDPYPTGSPPSPEVDFKTIHGYTKPAEEAPAEVEETTKKSEDE
jgi:hypothetical protein